MYTFNQHCVPCSVIPSPLDWCSFTRSHCLDWVRLYHWHTRCIDSHLHLLPHFCALHCYTQVCVGFTHLYRCCLVTKSRLALCDPMDCSMPGFPILHCLLEFDQTHVHWVGGDIQPSHLLLPPSPPVPNLCSWPTSGSFPMNWLFTSSGYFSIITDELRVNKWLWCFGVKKKYNYADTLKMTISLIQGGEFMYMRLVNL